MINSCSLTPHISCSHMSNLLWTKTHHLRPVDVDELMQPAHGAMHRGNGEWFGCSGDVAATSTRGDSTKLVNPWIWGEPRHGQPVMWPWEVVEVHKLPKPLAKCIMGPWVLDKSCGEELDFWLMLYALRLDEGTKYEPWMMFKVILYYLVYLELAFSRK
jgi:hypothetical protein